MPHRRNRNVSIAKRRQRVADLYIQGWTQMAIAAELGIAQATVSMDLKRVQQAWRESSIRDFDLAREVELQKLIRIEREAWAAWERSQKPAQEARVKEGNATKTVKTRSGDARFLEIVLRCIVGRRELLALDLMENAAHGMARLNTMDVRTMREELLHQDEFLDYCRTNAIDVESHPINEDGLPKFGLNGQDSE